MTDTSHISFRLRKMELLKTQRKLRKSKITNAIVGYSSGELNKRVGNAVQSDPIRFDVHNKSVVVAWYQADFMRQTIVKHFDELIPFAPPFLSFLLSKKGCNWAIRRLHKHLQTELLTAQEKVLIDRIPEPLIGICAQFNGKQHVFVQQLVDTYLAKTEPKQVVDFLLKGIMSVTPRKRAGMTRYGTRSQDKAIHFLGHGAQAQQGTYKIQISSPE